MTEQKVVVVGNEQEAKSALSKAVNEQKITQSLERVDFLPAQKPSIQVLQRMMPEIGTELVLPNGALTKVVYHNAGKGRMTLRMVGYLRPQRG